MATETCGLGPPAARLGDACTAALHLGFAPCDTAVLSIVGLSAQNSLALRREGPARAEFAEPVR